MRQRPYVLILVPRRRLLGVLLGLILVAGLGWSPAAITTAGQGLRLVASEAQLQPIRRGPATGQRMSLMINVDWGDEYIPEMLETLARHSVVATWFPTGRWAQRAPELTRQIAEAGHELGNHGGWHGMASQMSSAEVRRLITEGEQAILEASGQQPRVFAPPAGDVNERAVAVAAELGYKTVLWTIDTIDWRRPAAQVIIDRVVGRAQPGALVLMHPTEPTAQALPAILKQLLSLGYELVTVSQMLGD